MGGPLPSRKHIVLTRSPDTLAQYPSVYTASNVEDALIKARQVLAENYGLEPEILIGGGAEIYQAFLPHTQKIYLTLIHKKFDGDAFFPEFSNQEFKLTHQLDRQEPIPYSFCTYERI